MPLFAQSAQQALLLVATLAIVACAAAWLFVVSQWQNGRPIPPYQPRRPVPWKGYDAILALGIYFILPMGIILAASDWFGVNVEMSSTLDGSAEFDTAHPLARVLAEAPNTWAVLVCLVAAVVIAPVTEELLFRLIVQGWLETGERRLRHRLSRRQRMTAGLIPIILSSGLFAALHFRAPMPRVDVNTILFLIQARSIASLLTIVLMLGWLRLSAKATLTDFGIVPQRFWSDLKLGLLAFLLVTVPVYGLLIAMMSFLPKDTITDPLPIFALAVALGTLYYRTHRILPSIVLHTAFNAAGVILAIWTSP